MADEEPAEKPVEKPVERPVEEPEEKIEEQSAERPEETPEEKPAERPVEKPEEEPKKERPVIKSKVFDEIKEALKDKIVDSWIMSERRPFIIIKGEDILEVAKTLVGMEFDHLSAISGVEYGDRMECAYHIWSYSKRELVTVKAVISKDNPKIDSLTPVWKSADWHERETYDLMGIVFEGHPDLRRILLPDDFKGHPLRKDFELTEKPW